MQNNLNRLIIITFIISFTIWGINGILITEIGRDMDLSNSNSVTLVNTFIAVMYAFSIAGGYIVDKLLSKKATMQLGVLVLISGLILALIMSANAIWLAISCIITGATFTETVKLTVLHELYPDDNYDRSRAFNFCFASINLSSALGPLVFAYLARYWSWQAPFTMVIFINLWAYYLITKLPEQQSSRRSNNAILILLVSICILIGKICLENSSAAGLFNKIVLCICIAYFTKLMWNLTATEKTNVLKIIGVMCLVLLFYVMYYQLHGTMIYSFGTLVDRNIYSVVLPESFLFTFQTIMVVLFASKPNIFKKLFGELSIFNSLILGLFIGALAFIWFGYMFGKNIEISIWQPFFAAVLLAIGEVLLSPTMSSAVMLLSPKDMQGRINGIAILSLSLASGLAGLIGASMLGSEESNFKGYINLACLSLAMCVAALIVARCFSRFSKSSVNL